MLRSDERGAISDLAADLKDEVAVSTELRAQRSPVSLIEEYSSVAWLDSIEGERRRRILLRALCRSFGRDVRVGLGARVLHPETFEIGERVVIGDAVVIHGRFDGRCTIGAGTTIGSQAYLHCIAAELGEEVIWGPGAKLLGGEHTAFPVDRPITETDIVIRPVRIGSRARIGAGAVILPGVTVGEDAVVAPAAVVTADVPPGVTVSGIPAREVTRPSRSVG